MSDELLILILLYVYRIHTLCAFVPFAPLNILGELLCHKAQGLRIGKGYTILRAAMDACSSRKETASCKMCKFYLERELKLHELGGLFCCPHLLNIAVSQLCMSAQL